MRAVVILVWILSLVPVAATALSLVKSAKWWVRVWDYPRLQLAVALIVMAVAQTMALPRTAVSAGLFLMTTVAALWQLFRIYPYTPLKSKQVAPATTASPADTISLLVANVLQENRNAAAFLRRVEESDPDVVLAVETSGWWDARIASLGERYPHSVRHPLENTYGMHLFSRLELRDVQLQERVERDVPSIRAQVRLRSGQLINLHCVHPEPPQVGNDVEERDAELLLVAREAAGDRRPTIVCGDLNDVAWSHTTRLFQRISGLLDPRVGRGLFPTFHAGHWFARWPLDHVFHDVTFRLARLAVLDAFGSDHFPVYVRLVHDPRAAREHEAPVADADDRQEAAEKIAEA
jgi:endonuclease/exonuclease/phosphatase (EEP) superfamily protein YafD